MSGERLIPTEAVDGAFSWLLSSSDKIASARANVIRAEYKVKRVYSRLYKAAEGSIESRKAWAIDHDEYAEAIEMLAQAEEAWEYAKDQRHKAEIIIEAWRTEQASRRAVDRMR